MVHRIAFLHSMNPAVVPEEVGDRGGLLRVELPLQGDFVVALAVVVDSEGKKKKTESIRRHNDSTKANHFNHIQFVLITHSRSTVSYQHVRSRLGGSL